MASPDRLDQPIKLVSSANWLFLGSVAVLLTLSLIWAFVTEVPIKVSAQGILFNPHGLSEVVVEYDGRVDEVLVTPGDTVVLGDVVARLTRNDKRREVQIAEASVQNALNQAENGETAFLANKGRMQRAEQSRMNSIDTRLRELKIQLRAREAIAKKIRRLVSEDIATTNEQLDSEERVNRIRTEMRSLDQERLDVSVEAAQRKNTREQDRLHEAQMIDISQRELQRLKAQVDEEVAVIAQQSGRVVELKVNRGDVVVEGSAFATIDPMMEGDALEAVLFVPPAGGKRVLSGMQAQIVPTTVEREIFGHINGTVISVALLPSTRNGMRRYLQNDSLVDELFANGAPIEVRVALEKNAANVNGYDWSSSRGPDSPLTQGTLLTSGLVVERRAIIDIAFPGVRARLAHLFGS